jgi:hypothetical protein
LAAHSGKKQDWQHIFEKIYNWQQILWENMIGRKFWGKNMTDNTSWKKHDWEHILGKTMIHSTFW